MLLVVGGCGGGDDGAADSDGSRSGSASEPASESPEEAEGAGAPGTVELLEAGAEPRAELRFDLEAGQTFRTTMTMDMAMEMSIDGQSVPTPTLPAMEVLIDGRIEEVDDGTATYTFTYGEIGTVAGADVDPAVAKQYETALQSMQGLTGTGSIDTRGNVGESTLDTSKVTDPNLKATLDSVTSQISSMTVPFPKGAVGIGARWRAVRRTVINGITTDATTTYVLESRDGARYALDIVQEVTAPAGPVDIPGLGAARAEVVDYQMENTGEVEGDVTAMLPTSSTISGEGDIRMKVIEGGKTSDLVQKLTLRVSFAEA